MSVLSEKKEKNIRRAFDKFMHIDVKGAKITPATGFRLLREVDERLCLLEQTAPEIEDQSLSSQRDYSLSQFLRQRV
jgi:hypothetical protein